MPLFPRTLLAASIGAALYVPQTLAEAMINDSVQELPAIDQCLVDVPEQEDATQLPIKVEADSLEAISGDKATYSGNVVVVQGKKRIRADNVTLHQQDNMVVAEGNVQFSDGEFQTQSDRATNDLNKDQITLENTQYKFLCEPGRGEAVYISKTGKAVYKIEDGSITSCPDGDNAWRMKASSIDVDQEKEQAVFHHTRFEILDVPVMYVPYITLPIGDTRKSGFLYPTISYGSSDGFKTEIPYYWNLAPNYDLTTTYQYLQNRGNQFDTDFRYLTQLGAGNFRSEYLIDDKKYPDQGDRWGFQYKHSGIYQQQWKFDIDYSQVSDIRYFSDVRSNIGNREDGQLIQKGSAMYRASNWDTSIVVKDFQVLTEDGNQPYQLLPQLNFNYYAPALLPYLDFDMVSHISQFETDDPKKPSATRIHVEPGLKVPLSSTWGNWTTEARLLGTYYQQEIDHLNLSSDNFSNYDLKPETYRVIPEFRSHAGLVLERDTVVLGNYTQTLEPQIQYLYVPEQDQSDIYLYDTTLVQYDYYGLFRSRRYSGVDRIAAANQFSYGASTRLFDDGFKERFNLSFGQIFYLDTTNKYLRNQDRQVNSNFSAWAVEMDFNLNDNVFYHGGVQYDLDTSSVQSGNSTLEYQFDGGFIQTNYRYVSKEYIQNTVDFDVNTITRNGISQGGLMGSYQLSRKWHASAQYFYDFTTRRELEWVANLNYLSDCWYIGFTYSNQLRRWEGDYINTDNATPIYENNFSFKFGIVGFGTSIGAGSGNTGIDNADNSLGYGRPFFLNN
ncbi:LPS assembly protein LptD [Vibrio sp.]|uniref:LPS assembly protein LptD n=1 Tax=Vibrio sp. TaxID=678 RepID=UPI003D0BF688